MHIADLLSRAYLSTSDADAERRDDVIAIAELEEVNAMEFTRVTDERFSQIRRMTLADEQLVALKTTILTGWPDTKDELQLGIREYWGFRDELAFHNGVVFRGNRVVIPKLMRPEMLIRIHSSIQVI